MPWHWRAWGLGMGEWRSPMCGSDTCTQSAVPGVPRPPARRAGGRPTSRTAHGRPRDIQFNCRHGRRARRRLGTRAPDVQSPGAGRPTLNQTPARPRSLVRHPSVVLRGGCWKGEGMHRAASHRDCTASARLGSSSPGSSRSGRDTPHGRWRDRPSEQSIAASRDVNAARRPSVSTQGSIEM